MGSLLLRAMSVDLFGRLANFVAPLGREAGVCSGEREGFEAAGFNIIGNLYEVHVRAKLKCPVRGCGVKLCLDNR